MPLCGVRQWVAQRHRADRLGSRSSQYCNGVCPERWALGAGVVVASGTSTGCGRPRRGPADAVVGEDPVSAFLAAPGPNLDAGPVVDPLSVSSLSGGTGACYSTANPVAGPRRAGSVGLPLPGRELRRVDERGFEVPLGTDGEVIVRGRLDGGAGHSECAARRVHVQRRSGVEMAELWETLRDVVDNVPAPVSVTVKVQRSMLAKFLSLHGAELAAPPPQEPADTENRRCSWR